MSSGTWLVVCDPDIFNVFLLKNIGVLSMKRLSALIAVLWVMLIFCPSIGLAQSEKEGIVIFNEAKGLRDKARSKEDKEKALQKYQQALEIFERTKSDKLQGITLGIIGQIYNSWRQYQKALEYYEKALRIHQKTGNRIGEGNSLNDIANTYQGLYQYR